MVSPILKGADLTFSGYPKYRSLILSLKIVHSAYVAMEIERLGYQVIVHMLRSYMIEVSSEYIAKRWYL